MSITLLKYSVAGLTVAMAPRFPTLSGQAIPYLTNSAASPDITVDLGAEFLRQKSAENPHLTEDSCEYIFSGGEFYRALPDFDGIMLHASAVELDGRAYLFSAPSGTGKSTHTALWLERFPAARIINDDKPALRIIGDKIFACGTPWSGKTDTSINSLVPLAGIAFLSRGAENRINPIPSAESIPLLLSQTLRPKDKAVKILDIIDKILTRTPVFALSCTPTIDAADCAYKAMSAQN